MKINLLLCLCLTLFVSTNVQAQEKQPGNGQNVKTLSGMSIVGNDEAPKALYIVPWKTSKVGTEIVLNMPERNAKNPADREEFRRRIDYYNISKTSKAGR